MPRKLFKGETIQGGNYSREENIRGNTVLLIYYVPTLYFLGHDEKIRIVLNKADMVNHQQLMRVYGALMWSLGKILNTPEVPRVYIGSFWNQPLVHTTNQLLFEIEEQDLFRDLQSLPRNAALRKLNDFIKRARLAKVSV